MEPNANNLNPSPQQSTVAPPQTTAPNNSGADTSVKSSDWPGAFGIYKISKSAVMQNLSTFVSLWIIIGLFYVVDLIFQLNFRTGSGRLFLIFIFDIIISVLAITVVYTAIESVKSKKVSVGEAYSAVFSKFVNIIIVNILVGIISLISFVLLIIPAFFVIPRIALSIYFVMDKNMSPMEAIKASWATTKHNVGKVYGIIGVNILIALISITIIGILATIYFGVMYVAAMAILYSFLTTNKSNSTPTTPTN